MPPSLPKCTCWKNTSHSLCESGTFHWDFYCEQEGEGIQHEFVHPSSTVSNAKPATSRLKMMLEEHHLVVHPKNREMIPEKKGGRRGRGCCGRP